MKIACPVCNAAFPIEAGLTDTQAREAIAAALALPAPLGDRILRYLGLFRPHSRVLAWDRVARLLHELHAAIGAGRVERHGRAWAAPHALWEAAFDQILSNRAKLQLPLKSHGYLFEIVAGMASKAEGFSEKHEIDQARNPYRALTGPRAQEVEISRDPAVAAAALGTLKHLTKGKP